MSNLSGWFNPTYKEETIEVVISDRFVDEQGEPLPFKLRALSQEKRQAIAKQCMKVSNVKGVQTRELDNDKYLNRLIVEACIQPDFKDRELCLAYGTEDPLVLPQKMLLVREFEALGTEILKQNGFDDASEATEEANGDVSKKSKRKLTRS